MAMNFWGLKILIAISPLLTMQKMTNPRALFHSASLARLDFSEQMTSVRKGYLGFISSVYSLEVCKLCYAPEP